MSTLTSSINVVDNDIDDDEFADNKIDSNTNNVYHANNQFQLPCYYHEIVCYETSPSAYGAGTDMDVCIELLLLTTRKMSHLYV